MSKIKNKKISNQRLISLVNATEISQGDYQNFLSKVQQHVTQTQSRITKIVTREKVVMAWEIGKLIDEYSPKNNKDYGKKLIEKLARDIFISETVLYKMRGFYKTYPKLPKDDERLNWSHYRVLSGIKKTEERKYLEDLTKQNGWDVQALQQEVNKSKMIEVSVDKKMAEKIGAKFQKEEILTKKLRLERGKLFSYPLIKLEDTGKTYIDCGFNFFREVEEGLPQNAVAVDVIKKNKNYSLKKSAIHPRKFNTYKAYLERVVDGDTIHVTLDLGFKTLHKEIIRLKGIDAPELKTDEGKKSSKALSKILKNIPFLVVKTLKIDIYGRYVADVFLANSNSENDAQKVADEGVYLNQILLDKSLAVVLRM